MTVATDMRLMAEDLLADLGRTVTYRQRSQNVDPDTGVAVPGAATDTTLNAALVQIRDLEARPGGPGTQPRADLALLVASKDLDDASITPAKGDQVVIGSQTAEVVGIEETAVQDQTALHRLLLRY